MVTYIYPNLTISFWFHLQADYSSSITFDPTHLINVSWCRGQHINKSSKILRSLHSMTIIYQNWLKAQIISFHVCHLELRCCDFIQLYQSIIFVYVKNPITCMHMSLPLQVNNGHYTWSCMTSLSFMISCIMSYPSHMPL